METASTFTRTTGAARLYEIASSLAPLVPRNDNKGSNDNGTMTRRTYYVYILTNKRHTVLYTGVTGDIHRRLEEHREGRGSAFTRRYNVNKLVYFEEYEYIYNAIDREKQIKGGSRAKKEALINETNPEWRDLSEDLQLY